MSLIAMTSRRIYIHSPVVSMQLMVYYYLPTFLLRPSLIHHPQLSQPTYTNIRTCIHSTKTWVSIVSPTANAKVVGIMQYSSCKRYDRRHTIDSRFLPCCDGVSGVFL